jgi:hypothetical protein
MLPFEKQEAALRARGPYAFSRQFLVDSVPFMPKPSLEQAHAWLVDDIGRRLEEARTKMADVLEIPFQCFATRQNRSEFWASRSEHHPELNRDLSQFMDQLWDTATGRAVRAYLGDVETGLRALNELRSIVDVERTFSNVLERRRGAPKEIWKHDFVAVVARLWRCLTGEPPRAFDHTYFADFVYAVWRSLSEDMEGVSFASAIRNHASVASEPG